MASFFGAVDVCWEQLIDETAEHHVADEIDVEARKRHGDEEQSIIWRNVEVEGISRNKKWHHLFTIAVVMVVENGYLCLAFVI